MFRSDSKFRPFCRAPPFTNFNTPQQLHNNSTTQPETIRSLNIMSALSLFLSQLFEETGTERVNIQVDNVMSALSLFLSQLFEENGTERVNIQVDNVKQTHSSFQRRTSSLEAVLSRSDRLRDRWSGITNINPRQQKSRNTERAGSVDSLLALPRRKQSNKMEPISTYSTITTHSGL
jgi:hypothetical protein